MRKLKLRFYLGRETVPCCFCLCPLTADEATLDHIVPLAKGGNNHFKNLAIACERCNHDRDVTEFWTYLWRCRERQAA